MSHFSVLVIGPDIEAQLQPYHEFESTGTVDQYVVDVDITEETRAGYATENRTYYVVPGGKRLDRADARLFREITADEHAEAGPFGFIGSAYGGGKPSYESRDWGDGRGHRAKIFDPKAAGAAQLAVPVRECVKPRRRSTRRARSTARNR